MSTFSIISFLVLLVIIYFVSKTAFRNSSDTPAAKSKLRSYAILRDFLAPKRISFAFCVHPRNSSVPCLNCYCLPTFYDSGIISCSFAIALSIPPTSSIIPYLTASSPTRMVPTSFVRMPVSVIRLSSVSLLMLQ